jgi:fructose-bisphosphate aldolase class 1
MALDERDVTKIQKLIMTELRGILVDGKDDVEGAIANRLIQLGVKEQQQSEAAEVDRRIVPEGRRS